MSNRRAATCSRGGKNIPIMMTKYKNNCLTLKTESNTEILRWIRFGLNEETLWSSLSFFSLCCTQARLPFWLFLWTSLQWYEYKNVNNIWKTEIKIPLKMMESTLTFGQRPFLQFCPCAAPQILNQRINKQLKSRFLALI